MWNYFRDGLLAIIVLSWIVGYVGYQAYDEQDVTPGSFSRIVRTYLYERADANDPRVILEPDLGADIRPIDRTDYDYGLEGEGYVFTSDWHSAKAPAWTEALKDFAGKPNIQYLEIGVYEGRAVAWMFENILTHPTSHATGIDIFIGELGQGNFVFQPESQQLYENNVAVAGGAGRSTTIADFSQNAMRELPSDYFDIIYIDGGHRGSVVLEDAILAFRLLKVGGVLIFDDYRWFKAAPRVNRPGYAIDIFEEFFGENYELLHNQYQYILRKTGQDLASDGLDYSLRKAQEATADEAAEISEEET